METFTGHKSQFSAAKSGEALVVIGERREWKITTRANAIASNAQGQDWEKTLAGIKGFDLSISGNLNLSDATGGQAVLTEGELIDFECFPENVAGYKFSGQARITGVEITGGLEDVVSISITAKGNGALVRDPGA